MYYVMACPNQKEYGTPKRQRSGLRQTRQHVRINATLKIKHGKKQARYVLNDHKNIFRSHKVCLYAVEISKTIAYMWKYK